MTPVMARDKREIIEAINETWDWFLETGRQVIAERQMLPRYANAKIVEELKADMQFSPDHKELEKAVTKFRPYLTEHYGIFQLQWVVEFSELYLDLTYSIGQPIGFPSRYRPLWDTYLRLLGEPPKDAVLPPGTNWYWIVRRYYRQADRQYIDDICSKYLADNPDAICEVANIQVPNDFIEQYGEQVTAHELYLYLVRHWKDLGVDRRFVERDMKRSIGDAVKYVDG